MDRKPECERATAERTRRPRAAGVNSQLLSVGGPGGTALASALDPGAGGPCCSEGEEGVRVGSTRRERGRP